MVEGMILRVFMVILGIYILGLTILSLAKRKMSEQFCLVWAGMAVLMVVAGLVLQPSEVGRFISVNGIVLAILALIGVLWGLWFISIQVSVLMHKNQELAMQVSLLNKDMEQVLKESEKLKRKLQAIENGEKQI